MSQELTRQSYRKLYHRQQKVKGSTRDSEVVEQKKDQVLMAGFQKG